MQTIWVQYSRFCVICFSSSVTNRGAYTIRILNIDEQASSICEHVVYRNTHRNRIHSRNINAWLVQNECQATIRKMLLPQHGIWVIHFHYLYNQGISRIWMDNVMRGIQSRARYTHSVNSRILEAIPNMQRGWFVWNVFVNRTKWNSGCGCMPFRVPSIILQDQFRQSIRFTKLILSKYLLSAWKLSKEIDAYIFNIRWRVTKLFILIVSS